MHLDPWSAEDIKDYKKVMKDFGLERFDKTLFEAPNRLMRRGAVFAGRDLKRIAKAIDEKKPFYALTGIMPSAPQIHFGTKAVVEQLRYFQDCGAHTYILVADLEASAARGVTLEEARERALEFHIPAYLALGLDPKKTTFYFQSENLDAIRLGYRASQKITLNEFRAVYGVADPGRIMSAVTQIGDMLYPQLDSRMPGVIPVGVDQDPHIRLCRDFTGRTKKEKWVPISSIYHKYTRSLDGSLKMSKSKPESCLSLPEDEKSIKKKIGRAKSGGRETLEEQREKGAIIEEDTVFSLLEQHLVDDDEELARIREEYSSGRMTTGELKAYAIDLLNDFMKEFTKKLDAAREQVNDLTFVRYGKLE